MCFLSGEIHGNENLGSRQSHEKWGQCLPVQGDITEEPWVSISDLTQL